MNKKRLFALVLAALVLAALLILLLASREGRRYGETPPAPDNTFVGPPLPSAADLEAERKVRMRNAAAKAERLRKAEAAAVKPVKRRKKRVSRLREPGDAMGGGVRLILTDKRPGLKPKK